MGHISLLFSLLNHSKGNLKDSGLDYLHIVTFKLILQEQYSIHRLPEFLSLRRNRIPSPASQWVIFFYLILLTKQTGKHATLSYNMAQPTLPLSGWLELAILTCYTEGRKTRRWWLVIGYCTPCKLAWDVMEPIKTTAKKAWASSNIVNLRLEALALPLSLQPVKVTFELV
jgi:hypothetical protein